ncbi:MAG: class I SAM-dependent methyltransferase, partial [Desulfobulbaceae bacterium]|nr:class I SAM-dependent methyltransferase [Desulfobulbaceae bacterium]
PGGILVLRVVLNPAGKPSWSWRLEDTRIRLSGHRAGYRSADEMAVLMQEAGFTVQINEVTKANPELIWMVGRADSRVKASGKK